MAQGLIITVPYLIVIVVTQTTTDPAATEPSPVALGLLALMGLLWLALFLPSLAVTVRRLHDTGRTGWWYVISLVPPAGIVLLVFSVMDSTPGTNQWGPNPKGVGGDAYGGQGYGGQGYGAPQPYGTPQA